MTAEDEEFVEALYEWGEWPGDEGFLFNHEMTDGVQARLQHNVWQAVGDDEVHVTSTKGSQPYQVELRSPQ
jgi:hypothetical protein